VTPAEAIRILRRAAWALLGSVLALEHGETPRQGLGEVIARLERVRAAEEANHARHDLEEV
jgi:hypothetical protein